MYFPEGLENTPFKLRTSENRTTENRISQEPAVLAYFLISFNCAKFQQNWTTLILDIS